VAPRSRSLPTSPRGQRGGCTSPATLRIACFNVSRYRRASGRCISSREPPSEGETSTSTVPSQYQGPCRANPGGGRCQPRLRAAPTSPGACTTASGRCGRASRRCATVSSRLRHTLRALAPGYLRDRTGHLRDRTGHLRDRTGHLRGRTGHRGTRRRDPRAAPASSRLRQALPGCANPLLRRAHPVPGWANPARGAPPFASASPGRPFCGRPAGSGQPLPVILTPPTSSGAHRFPLCRTLRSLLDPSHLLHHHPPAASCCTHPASCSGVARRSSLVARRSSLVARRSASSLVSPLRRSSLSRSLPRVADA